MVIEPGKAQRVSIRVGETVTLGTQLDTVGSTQCEMEASYDEEIFALEDMPAKVVLGAGNHERADAWTFKAKNVSSLTEIKVTATSDAGIQPVTVRVEVR